VFALEVVVSSLVNPVCEVFDYVVYRACFASWLFRVVFVVVAAQY